MIKKVLTHTYTVIWIIVLITGMHYTANADTPRGENNQAATITVITPNGGEQLTAGNNYYINWTWPDSTNNVKIEYTVDNGSTWTTIISSTDNDGYFYWYIPNTPSTLCKVRVSDVADGNPYDVSDSVFTIKPAAKIISVTSPNGSEVLAVGSLIDITWTSAGTSGNVKIEYSTNNFSNLTAIVSSTPDDGSYSWTVPNTPSTNCRVHIIDAADSGLDDWSNAVFSISTGTTIPTVTTDNISSITYTSAVGGGNVTADGGAAVTARGVCWNTAPNPTVNNFKTINGSGTGTFTGTLTGLTPGTTYYVRAYAANSNGTAYGTEKSFTTVPLPPVTYTLEVTSTPETGVFITVSPDDNNGLGSGTTDFTRTYNEGQAVTLIAPLTHNDKTFLKWTLDDVDQTGRTITFTMDKNRIARVFYQAGTYTLYVESTPETGVPVTVTPNDNNGSGNGATYFTRIYNTGQAVTLTAPQTYNGKNFLRWQVDGINQTNQLLTVIVTMDSNHTARVVYQAASYNLTIRSSPANGVPITVTPADQYNRGDGITEFTRTYDYGIIVTLTAPASYSGKNFMKWLVDGVDKTNPVTINMDSSHIAQAVYQSPTYTLSVQSSPNQGVVIEVAPVDKNGNGNGITGFTRVYNTGSIVTLTAPSLSGSYDFIKWTVEGKEYFDSTIQVTMEGNRTALADYSITTPPGIGVSRTKLNLGYIMGSSVQPEESFTVFNSGGGTLNWTINNEFSSFSFTPTSGTNCEEVHLSVDPGGRGPGEYNGVIYVSAPLADNSPVEIEINLWVKSQASPPFGDFSTPLDGTTVSSSIPVTGWVLGETGMESVKIYREEGTKLVFIGDANFVEGARPDIENTYPDYPMNYKAGWGYMMLTNFLPNGGNGTFKIYAIATDREGLKTNLGIKTITVDNAHAVKPFGAIDKPEQGGTASGNRYMNLGWVLTPPPNSVPIDGTAINVYVDGVNLGHPVYNLYRSDVAGLFPGYANSNGAAGYFYLDTTAYEDGQHTILWTAADSAGNTDGIGSRYFTINNSCLAAGNTAITTHRTEPYSPVDLSQIPPNHFDPVRVWKGSRRDALEPPLTIYPNDQGIIVIETRELEPLEIHFFTQEKPGETPALEILSPTPIGSSIHREKGIFYWQPGPGFTGDYRLLFIERCREGQLYLRETLVKILPKFGPREPKRVIKTKEP